MGSVKVFPLKDKRYFAMVDFGKGDSMAIASIYRNDPNDNRISLIKQSILGKTIYIDKERQKQIIDEIKEFKITDSPINKN